MTHESGTAAQLVAAAQALFAEHGYHGTSVRAITQAAGVNLGAITYHFGSKQALYEAALGSLMGPSADHLAAAVDPAKPPLERVEQFVRAMFDYLHRHPELPRFLAQHLAAALPITDVARETMRRNSGLAGTIVADGQRDGTIRDGNPQLLALSVIAQPIFLSLVRNLLAQGLGLDQGDQHTRAGLEDSVVRFVCAALARPA